MAVLPAPSNPTNNLHRITAEASVRSASYTDLLHKSESLMGFTEELGYFFYLQVSVVHWFWISRQPHCRARIWEDRALRVIQSVPGKCINCVRARSCPSYPRIPHGTMRRRLRLLVDRSQPSCTYFLASDKLVYILSQSLMQFECRGIRAMRTFAVHSDKDCLHRVLLTGFAFQRSDPSTVPKLLMNRATLTEALSPRCPLLSAEARLATISPCPG